MKIAQKSSEYTVLCIVLTDSRLTYLRFDEAISEAKKTSKNPKKNAEKFGGKEKVATFAPAKPNNTGFSKTFSLKDWQKKVAREFGNSKILRIFAVRFALIFGRLLNGTTFRFGEQK